MLVIVRYTSMLNLMKVSFFSCAFSMTKHIQKDKKFSKIILRIIRIYDNIFFYFDLLQYGVGKFRSLINHGETCTVYSELYK